MRKLVALVMIAFIASSILFGHRLIVNRTHSLPVGLYYWSDVPIKKGSIVLFKPDQSTPLEQRICIGRGGVRFCSKDSKRLTGLFVPLFPIPLSPARDLERDGGPACKVFRPARESEADSGWLCFALAC